MTDSNRHIVDTPHPDDRLDPAKTGRPGTIRRVAVNMRESPVAWLYSRCLLDARQHAAADRLRADYERARLSPSVTMCWDNAGSPGKNRRGAPNAPDLSGTQIDARRRFDGAIAHAGAGLSDILWRSVCAGEGLAAAEKALGWPGRSGRVILALALDRVADFYGIR